MSGRERECVCVCVCVFCFLFCVVLWKAKKMPQKTPDCVDR